MKEKSEREGREYAVAICKVNDNYLLGEMIAGREHEIAVISRCESGDRVGIIHTHPRRKYSEFSSVDLMPHFYDDQFICVIATKSNTVRCITYPKNKENRKELFWEIFDLRKKEGWMADFLLPEIIEKYKLKECGLDLKTGKIIE